MGKIEFLSITFQQDTPNYLAGETMHGQILVRASERLKINSLTLKVLGKALVHWLV
jgi:hypothetical protein